MILFLILLTTEILTITVLRQHLYDRSWMTYYFTMIVHAVFSIWIWILWYEIVTYKGIFDEADHIWLLTSMSGIFCAVVIPRIFLIIFHFWGRFIKRKLGGHSRPLTRVGIILGLLILAVLGTANLYGRFNFKTENYTVKIKALKPDLNGFRLVQISDLHLTSFYHHRKVLEDVMNDINALNPDLVINTGDFVTIGWREFGRYDTILSIPKGEYGNFAILGNHDMGTYDPYFTEADRENNVLLMNKFLKLSDYNVLNDESVEINVGSAKIALIGVKTMGRFPHMVHGDLDKAMAGTEGADLRILLSHDPNHWEEKVKGRTSIELTLSGHTHGMQMGIMTKKFKWSPAKYFYPRWNGLYREGDQYLFVNRGLGVLGMPFRIWMPPEISVITIVPE
ncbi:MAG: metallophosphoesterase [Bacteroidota bacterium]|nr:metallophosphoesterase [Bacteroidota bacterium]